MELISTEIEDSCGAHSGDDDDTGDILQIRFDTKRQQQQPRGKQTGSLPCLDDFATE